MSPQTTVHLLRHGEVHNPGGILYGRSTGYHLSTRGQAMADRVAERLGHRDITHVIASPLERAQETGAPLAAVRDAVLELRGGKGMVLDADDHDTWSAGSFFTNPFLTPEQAAALPDDAPRWEQPDGTVKSSAGWLIEHAGFAHGWTSPAAGERVSLSTKHTLALTNRGGATTDELLTLAREVRDGVEARFGVRLVNEPVTVGCSL